MNEKKNKILIIDDTPAWWVRPTKKLKNHFEPIDLATDKKAALKKINEANNEITKYDAIILDRVFGNSVDEGKIIFQKIKEVDSSTPVIICSGTVKSSFMLKDFPGCAFAFEKESLNPGTDAVYKKFATDISLAIKESQNMRKLEENKFIIGKTERMNDIYKLILNLAPVDTSVLIRGESGTGKELIARELHYKGTRSSEPFIALNSAALPDNLLESELFGHVKGAFTGAIADKIGRFEMAEGGTIFLDEIGDISPNMQLRLLRVLQEREFEKVGGSKKIKVNVRVIAATNINLEEKVKKGAFREDLYYRLAVVEINLPSLRDRKIDIPELSKFYIEKFNKKLGKNVLKVRDDALKILTDYNWPGNIREFAHAVERAMIIASGGNVLLPEHFGILGNNIDSHTKSDNNANNTKNHEKNINYDKIVADIIDKKWRGKWSKDWNKEDNFLDKYNKKERKDIFINLYKNYEIHLKSKGENINDKKVASLFFNDDNIDNGYKTVRNLIYRLNIKDWL